MVLKEVHLVLLLFATQISWSTAFYYNDTAFINNIADVHMRNYYRPFDNQTLDLLRFLTQSGDINANCQRSLKRWIVGIEQNELWALKFLEATGEDEEV